jgi:hypothetical protein
MNKYVGEYRSDTVNYIKGHLEKLDEQIAKYERSNNCYDRWVACLQAKSNALIALSNVCARKELE